MNSVSSYSLTRADLVDQLKEQMSFLDASGKAFDGGAEGEAKRLAATIRVLVHDTRTATSLLTHLKVKDRLAYMDTASPILSHNLAATPGLVHMQSGPEGFKYVAPLGRDRPPPGQQLPPKSFAEWWEAPVTKDNNGELFSRKDYVVTMSNKEGGAHVDHTLDERYAQLTRGNSFGWSIHEMGDDDPKGRPVEHNPALPSVRQIAYELEATLKLHPLKLGLY